MSAARRSDVAIIGAGSAGAVVASRLSEDPAMRVVLIEAGPDYPTLESLPPQVRNGNGSAAVAGNEMHLWGYTARASAGQEPTPLPRGKIVGGCSAVNNQVFIRGTPEDFAAWVAAGNDRWSFDQVLPYYRKIETDLDFDDEWHGQDGPTRLQRPPRASWTPAQAAFADACREAGYPEAPDANAPRSTGIGPIAFNNVGGVRASTAQTYLAAARARPNLEIRPRTTVRRLHLDGSRVIGIDVASGGQPERIEADEYILCAGAIGSPHLLMLSGLGPPSQLEACGVRATVDLPGVGQHLGDHPVVWLTWRARPDAAPGLQVLQLALRFTASGSAFRNDLKIVLNNSVPASIMGSADTPQVALLAGLQLPVGVGELRLLSPRHDVQPSIDLKFLEEESDRRRLRECVSICLELAARSGLAQLLGERTTPSRAELADDASLDAWMSSRVKTSQHASGTCRMGLASDPNAVVDQTGRVHGIANLRIVDASIFPQIPRANLNATVLMVAERAAELIRAGGVPSR